MTLENLDKMISSLWTNSAIKDCYKNLEENKDADAYETLAGYIVYHNEDIPKQDEIININNLHFKMLKVDSSKIMEVYLKVLDKVD